MSLFNSVTDFRKYATKHVPEDSESRVLEVFLGVDLRLGHDGLADYARRRRVDVATLTAGQFVVFVNNAQDKIKVYATSHIVAYMQLAHGQKFDLRIIQEIPKAFSATGKIDYDQALKRTVLGALWRSGREDIAEVA